LAYHKQHEILLGMLLDERKSIEIIKEEFEKNSLKWNDKDSYCFLQFDFKTDLKSTSYSDMQIANIMSACTEIIFNYFSENNAACLIKQFEKSITLFLMKRFLNEQSLHTDLTRLRISIKQYFNITFKSVSSYITDTIEKARENSDCFFDIEDTLFYLLNGEHIAQSERVKIKKNHIHISQDCKHRLYNHIENGDNESARKVFCEIKEYLISQKEPSIHAKLALTHLIDDIMTYFNLYIPSESPLYEFQKELMIAEDIEDTFSVFYAFTAAIISQLLTVKIKNSDMLIRKALQYVDEHYAEKISLEDIAKYVGISKYYFSNLFKKENDINFSSYLNKVRIEKAKDLLKNPGFTVSQIFYQVGFNNQQYFSKIFKKYTGMTVTEYRTK